MFWKLTKLTWKEDEMPKKRKTPFVFVPTLDDDWVVFQDDYDGDVACLQLSAIYGFGRDDTYDYYVATPKEFYTVREDVLRKILKHKFGNPKLVSAFFEAMAKVEEIAQEGDDE